MQNPVLEPAPESWRLFIAIELPHHLRRKIKAHIDRLRSALPDVRASWTREDNIHLTLKFLGDVPVNQIESLAQALMRAATQTPDFDLVIRDCGSFPTRGKPKVLWIGIDDPSSNLPKLQAAVEDECAKAGFDRDQRSFHPHLTIARLRNPKGARSLAELHQEIGFEPVSVSVSEVCLIRSELSSAGSRYTVIARHEFSVDGKR
ncbi:MAG: RNA 2',3'-cyclic phosphodiesterase [Pyrinomonadaceae bacterium]